MMVDGYLNNVSVQSDSNLGEVQQHETFDYQIDVKTLKTTLRTIWGQVLREDPSDIADDDIFFAIGGDSISALSISTAAEKQGIAITVEEIFLNPSLEEMAQQARMIPVSKDREKGYPTPPDSVHSGFEEFRDEIQAITDEYQIQAHGIERVYPCTSMQESLVTMSDESTNLYVRQLVYKIQDHVSLDRLQQAWASTAQANPVLRTRIYPSNRNNKYLQAVHDEEIMWKLSSSLDDALADDINIPMRSGDPFFRYTLVRESTQDQYFIWTVHHALVDGASVVNLLDEASRRYAGEQVSIRPDFEDFVRLTTSTERILQDQMYWQETLLEVKPIPYPTLPLDSSLEVMPKSCFKRSLRLVENTELVQGLTKSLVLRSAWGILMSRYSGVEDVIFGTISSGRGSSIVPGIDQMTGPTINLLPVTLHVSQTASITAFLDQVRQQAVEMMPFEQASLTGVRRFLAEKASSAADFHTLFVVQSADLETQTASYLQKLGLEYLDDFGKKEQHSYPLVVTLTLSTDEQIQVSIEYDEHVISLAHIRNLFNQFQCILNQLGDTTPDASVGSISPLSEQDVEQIREWNKFTPPREQICYHELFKRQVCRQPYAEAVCSADLSLTYAEVDNCSTILAERLIQFGATPQTNVAVCFEKSVWTVVAILAVFKAGCVYLPIDVSHPRGRISEILEHAKVHIALASDTGARVLEGLCDVLTVEDPPLSSMIKSDFLPNVKPSDTAYILFTSGSTGKPKGMIISHSAICTSVLHHGPAFQAHQKWRILQFCAHTFDISVAEFLTTLAFGGCLCVPSEDERLNDLAGVITRLNVDTLLVVPTVANLLTPETAPSLKRIVLGGEPVTKETFNKWADHVWLTAGYGPSETSVYSSANQDVSRDSNPSCVGRAIGCSQWIVNASDHSQLSAIGVVGELVISGATLAKGYLGDTALTKAAFVPAPAWLTKLQPNTQFDMIYKTGDLARYNTDGTFDIIGRKDFQVKLRGLRIELGEIENRLMEHGSPTAVLAALPKVGPCKEQIVGVLSLQRSELGGHLTTDIALSPDNMNANAKALRESLIDHVSLTLPAYMIPSVWVFLEKMPLLVSGKVDRKRLKAWIDGMTSETYQSLLKSNADDEEEVSDIPSGSPADTLRHIWSSHLGYPAEKIRMNSTYISLAGDSIAAIRIVSEAKEKGLAVSVRQLLSQTTLEQMARRASVDNKMVVDVNDDETSRQFDGLMKSYEAEIQFRLRGHPQAEILDFYPVPPIQRQMRKSREINSSIFLLSWQMEIFPKFNLPLSPSKLARAWNRVVQKHPIFRTIFLKSSDPKIPELQLVLDKVQPELRISTFFTDETVPTLDVVLPPVDKCFLPHRAHFYQHGDKHFAHIELDHRTIDGWSFALIKKEFLAQYDATDEQPLGDLVPYRPFVTNHEKDRVERDTQYWNDVLRSLHPCLLDCPPTYPHSTASPSVRKFIIYVPKIPVRALSSFSASNGITPASVFYAAWAQTLAFLVQSTDISFEYVVWGRDQDVPGILDIIGPTLNVLPFHIQGVNYDRKPDRNTLAVVAHTIQEQRLQDSTYIACNPREVIEEDLGNPLPFNTAVNFQRRPTAVESETLKVDDRLTDSTDPWHFDVMVRVIHVEDDDTYFVAMEFDDQIFDREKMAEAMDMFHENVKIAYQ